MYEFDRAIRERTLTATAGSEPVSRRIRPERQLLFGEDIWANPVPSWTMQNARGLYTAFSDPEGRTFALGEGQLSKHLLLLGGIGSGKTNAIDFIVESILRKRSPHDLIVIFDTKGDYFDTFYDPSDPDHIVIGNGERYAALTQGWNVFGELEEADGSFGPGGEEAAREIARELFEGRQSSVQPFFHQAPEDLVADVLIGFERAARASGDRSRLNSAALTDWFKRAGLRQYISLIKRNPDFASAMLYFGDPGQGASQKLTGQALGVFGNINSMVNDLLTSRFTRSCPGGEFSMRRLVRERGKVAFVEYDLSAGQVLGPLYRIFFDLALKFALANASNRQGNVVFIVDEFKLLPGLLHMADALNFGRGLGVKIIAGLQNLDQIFSAYGREEGGSILSGFMNTICFQVPDASSRNWIKERFGENLIQINFRAYNEASAIQRAGHTIEDWDIASLAVGQAAVRIAGERPFIFQFSDFEKPHRVL